MYKYNIIYTHIYTYIYICIFICIYICDMCVSSYLVPTPSPNPPAQLIHQGTEGFGTVSPRKRR